MGLAAAKVGWEVKDEAWKVLVKTAKHIDTSDSHPTVSIIDRLKGSLSYRLRQNKARVLALKDFNFYYR